jgi:hypothetical protein
MIVLLATAFLVVETASTQGSEGLTRLSKQGPIINMQN